MSQNTDTIDVRPEEAFDQNNLEKFLYGKLEGSKQSLIIRQFPEGKANLTYELKYGNYEYVLRRPPLGPVAPGSHDMKREHTVLSILQKAFHLAPKAYLYEDDPTIIGAPFFIMERRNGVVVRTRMPKEFSKIDDAGKQISEALIDALADLHKVNYSELGLENFGKPDGFIERQINGWYSRWTKAKHQESFEIEAIYNWLISNIPKTNNISLVHNDYKLDNVMYSYNKPNKLEAVFDWDMCTLGDPLSDLGSLLCYWSDPDDPPLFGNNNIIPKDETLLTRKELIYRYTKKSGFDTSNIDFYYVLGIFRLIGILAQIYFRYLRGQTSDKRFAHFGEAIPFIAKFALQIIKNKKI